VAYVAVRRYGYKGFEVAEALASSSPSVSRNIEKGEFILDNNKELKIEFPVT
jgi:hypothetical protein